jgi:hypothetical protein
MGHAFRARRAAATSAVVTKPIVPRTLFASPVDELALKANLALHGHPAGSDGGKSYAGLRVDDSAMEMDG